MLKHKTIATTDHDFANPYPPTQFVTPPGHSSTSKRNGGYLQPNAPKKLKTCTSPAPVQSCDGFVFEFKPNYSESWSCSACNFQTACKFWDDPRRIRAFYGLEPFTADDWEGNNKMGEACYYAGLLVEAKIFWNEVAALSPEEISNPCIFGPDWYQKALDAKRPKPITREKWYRLQREGTPIREGTPVIGDFDYIEHEKKRKKNKKKTDYYNFFNNDYKIT